jgi:hypothetical protein
VVSGFRILKQRFEPCSGKLASTFLDRESFFGLLAQLLSTEIGQRFPGLRPVADPSTAEITTQLIFLATESD